jgi:PTS system N-acetylglucosamine-specific IIA component
MTQVLAPVSGTSLEVGDVPDPVFASGMVGPGMAIDPDRGPQLAVAPISGRLAKLHPHAYLVVGDDGPGVLVHLGIDTVHLHGDGFRLVAAEDDDVDAGQGIVRWDPAYVVSTGLSPICAVVVLDCGTPAQPLRSTGAAVRGGEPIFDITC